MHEMNISQKGGIRDPDCGRQSPTKRLQSAAFYFVVHKTVHKCVAKPQTVDVVARRMIDAPSFTALAAKLVHQWVYKGAVHSARTEEQFNGLTGSVEEKEKKIEDGIQSARKDSVQSTSPPTELSNDKKTNSRHTV